MLLRQTMAHIVFKLTDILPSERFKLDPIEVSRNENIW